MELEKESQKRFGAIKIILRLLFIGILLWIGIILFGNPFHSNGGLSENKNNSLSGTFNEPATKEKKPLHEYIREGSLTIIQPGDTQWVYFDWRKETPRDIRTDVLIGNEIYFTINNSNVIYISSPTKDPILPFVPDSICIWSDAYTELVWRRQEM